MVLFTLLERDIYSHPITIGGPIHLGLSVLRSQGLLGLGQFPLPLSLSHTYDIASIPSPGI